MTNSCAGASICCGSACLKLSAIQETISRIDPLPGAKDFLDALP